MKERTPMDPLERLKEGNAAYLASNERHIVCSSAMRKQLVRNGQHPFACVITCSDSRVVPEHIFSAGIGDLFVIRTAGNAIGDHELASAEYAASHLETSLIVVMGHTHCGAVEAALSGHSEGSMESILGPMRASFSDASDIRRCERENAGKGVFDLLRSPILSERVAKGELRIVSAIYETETGAVEFY